METNVQLSIANIGESLAPTPPADATFRAPLAENTFTCSSAAPQPEYRAGTLLAALLHGRVVQDNVSVLVLGVGDSP